MVGSRQQWASVRTRSLALTIGTAIAFVAGSALAKPASEHAVMAQFVERFTHFVTWPAGALPERDGELVIGVIGAETFTDYLRHLERRPGAKGRALRVHVIAELHEIVDCHVLYIDAGAADRLPAIVAITRDRPILTISHHAGFAREGVLINFYRSEGKLRFEINADAVQRSGLRLSSKLLRLSRIVGDRS